MVRILLLFFENSYDPTSKVHPDYPKEDVDFDRDGAYSLYNWEVFHHAPMLCATHLSENQRFEEAQKWFHYIFNPIDSSGDDSPQRYWKVLPFYNNSHPEQESIKTLLTLLSTENSKLNQEQKKRKELVIQQVKNGGTILSIHTSIARLRITAYQKNVVMKYMENTIALGDHEIQP